MRWALGHFMRLCSGTELFAAPSEDDTTVIACGHQQAGRRDQTDDDARQGSRGNACGVFMQLSVRSVLSAERLSHSRTAVRARVSSEQVKIGLESVGF